MGLKTYLKGSNYNNVLRGLHDVSQTDLKDNDLKNLNKISPEGIPNIWGAALNFSWLLVENSDDPLLASRINYTKEWHITILKGIFVGIFEIEELDLKNSEKKTKLMKLLYDMSPLNSNLSQQHFKLHFIKYNSNIVAVSYPESIIFPGAIFSFFPEQGSNTANEKSITEEKKILDLINDHYKGAEGKKIEMAFRIFIKKILDSNISTNKINIPWYSALQDYITKNPVDTSAQSAETEDSDVKFQILFDYTKDKLPDIRDVVFKKIKSVDVSAIKYEQGRIKVGSEEFNTINVGIVFDEVSKETFIYDNKKDTLLFGLFRWEYFSSGIELSHQQAKIKISGQIIKNPEDTFFVDKIIPLKSSDSHKMKKPSFPDSPIKSSFLRLVNNVSITEEQEGESIRYRVNVKGYGEIEKEYSTSKGNLEKINEEFAPNLVFWPDFYHEDWKAYYAYFNLAGKYCDRFKFRLINKYNEEFDLNNGETIRSNSQISYAVVYDQSNEFGIYNIDKKLEKLNVDNLPADIVSVGIDFGTSNTCVSYKLPREDIQMLSFAGLNYFEFFSEAGYISSEFFPTKKSGTEIEDILPSELYLKKGKNFLGAADWKEGPVNYSIPLIDSEETGNKFKSNLKWDNDQNYLKAYFYELFLIIFGNIYKEGYKNVKIGFSYPNAFSSKKYKDYFTSIFEVLKKIENETGIIINSVKTIDESSVGALAVGDLEKKKLVIDIGGGTTDIALMSEDGGVMFSESIKFAGTDFLNFVGKKTGTPKRTLSKYIRTGTTIEGIEKAEYELSVFFEIIFDSVKRFIAAIDPGSIDITNKFRIKDELNIYQLGQGWSFKNLSSINLTNVFDKFIQGYKFVPVDDPKRVLSKNIIKSPDGFISIDDYNNKLRGEISIGKKSIFGGNFKLYKNRKEIIRGKDGDEIIKWSERIFYKLDNFDINSDYLSIHLDSIESLLASGKLKDIIIEYDENNIFTRININEQINMALSDKNNNCIGMSPDGEVSLMVSPFVIFIEELKKVIINNIKEIK